MKGWLKLPSRKDMTLDEAKAIVRNFLKANGSKAVLRDMLNAMPQENRAAVARFISELRKQGAIVNTISKNNNAEIVHTVELPKEGE